MSQTSRSRIIAAQRHRRGLARVIAELELDASVFCGMCQGLGYEPGAWDEEETDCEACGGSGDGRDALALALLSSPDQGFDVHRAREYAKELKALEVEHAVFVHWTRARGKGPENREPWAFKGCPHPFDCHRMHSNKMAEGIAHMPFCPTETERGGWPGKLAREWPGDPRAPMGRSLARLGRRLLEALEGQPSECQECAGSGGPGNVEWVQWLDESVDDQPGRRPPPRCCESCRGTGHNLAGVLPPIEVTPAMRRKSARARPRVDVGAHSGYDARRGTMEENAGLGPLRSVDGGPRAVADA